MVTYASHGNHYTTHSTWKCFIQSNQRAICVCVCLLKDMCWLSEIHALRHPKLCGCGSQSDLRHLQPSKKLDWQDKQPWKTLQRAATTRGGREGEEWREGGNNKSIWQPSSYSAERVLRIPCQWEEREGFVCYYRTKQKHLEKVKRKKRETVMSDVEHQFSLPTDYVLFVVSCVIFFFPNNDLFHFSWFSQWKAGPKNIYIVLFHYYVKRHDTGCRSRMM